MSGPDVEVRDSSASVVDARHVTGPFEDREVVVLLLGIAMTAFVLNHLSRLKVQPGWQLLLAAVLAVALGWSVSVAEHLVSFPGSDLVEHGFYALHSLLLLSWVIVSSRHRRTS